MKHVMNAAPVVLLGLLVSFCAVANDSNYNRLKRSLEPLSESVTEINLKNSNLCNADLINSSDITPMPRVKTLDLSDNPLKEQLSLTPIFRIFPDLETLKVNNTRVTGFAVDTGFKNKTLKTLEAENTECIEVDLRTLYCRFDKLDTVDLSNSKNLKKFIFPELSLTRRVTMQVHLRNVVMEDDFKKEKIVDSVPAFCIKVGAVLVTVPLALIPYGILCKSSDQLLGTGYCQRSPISLQESDSEQLHYTKAFGNALIHVMPWVTGGLCLAFVAGKAITHYCLPNHGKVTAIKFIMNAADEAAETV